MLLARKHHAELGVLHGCRAWGALHEDPEIVLADFDDLLLEGERLSALFELDPHKEGHGSRRLPIPMDDRNAD